MAGDLGRGDALLEHVRSPHAALLHRLEIAPRADASVTMTLGLSPGLYLVAAITGTGKTALAGQVALHVAESHGPVVFVSMELTDVDLGVRLVSVLTNIKKEKLVVGGLSDEQHVEVHAAVERMSRSKLYMVYGSGYTTGNVRAHLLRAQAAEGVKPALLVVDYVQLLADQEGDGRSRERNVSAAAKGLKNLSGELGVPVLALVQDYDRVYDSSLAGPCRPGLHTGRSRSAARALGLCDSFGLP
jgi:replicative DNA helicase